MSIIESQLLTYLIWVLLIPIFSIGMKYFLYSDIWVEYSPMTPFYNRQLEKKINNRISKIPDKTGQPQLPSLTDDLSKMLDVNNNFREDVSENLIKQIDIKYHDRKCCISKLNLNNTTQLQLLFIPENKQYYLLTNTLLGKGESAKTFLGKNISTNEWVAIKKSNLKSKSRMIPNELIVLSASKEYNVLQENEYLLENNKLLGQLVKMDYEKKYIYTLMPWYFEKDMMVLPVDEKIRLSISLADEIDLLHSRGYLHNDLHIKNICWDGQKCHLIDFESMTRLDNILHCYFYATHSKFSHIAPEGIFGFNTRSKDIYAYGRILNELFKGSFLQKELEHITNQLTCTLANKRISLTVASRGLKQILENINVHICDDSSFSSEHDISDQRKRNNRPSLN